MNLKLKYVFFQSEKFTLKIIFFLFLTMSFSFADCVGIIFPVKSKNFYDLFLQIRGEINSQGDSVKLIDSNQDNIADAVQKIKDDGINYLVCMGNASIRIAAESKLPGIFLFIANPVKLGLINEDNDPLTSLTGIDINYNPGSVIKILNKIIPGDITIGTVYNPSESKYYIARLKETNPGCTIMGKEVSDSDSAISAFEEFKNKADYIMTFFDMKIYNSKILDFLLKFSMLNKIPLIGVNDAMTQRGALISFTCDFEELSKQVINILSKMKSGADPKSIKVTFTSWINYTVNLNTAEILKITLPDDIVKNAKKLFK